MKSCPQTDTQSVFQHGIAVWKMTKRLLDKKLDGLRIPEWFHQIKPSDLFPLDKIKKYTIFHDCGKPDCITIIDGKRHFPNHAEISYQVFKEFDPEVADLIRDDMVMHLKGELPNWERRHALTLLIVALAEIHANAEMFGGIDSDSFKIKWKRINQKGKQLCQKMLNIN